MITPETLAATRHALLAYHMALQPGNQDRIEATAQTADDAFAELLDEEEFDRWAEWFELLIGLQNLLFGTEDTNPKIAEAAILLLEAMEAEQ